MSRSPRSAQLCRLLPAGAKYQERVADTGKEQDYAFDAIKKTVPRHDEDKHRRRRHDGQVEAKNPGVQWDRTDQRTDSEDHEQIDEVGADDISHG
jgi:hypothetical protein